MKKIIILTIAMLILVSSASQLQAGVSDAAVLFLRIAAGARAAGMGEAFVAVADDATTTHWNPAGLGMYPLSSEYHTYKLGFNPHIVNLAEKIIRDKVDPDFEERYREFVFKADGIYRDFGDSMVSYEYHELDKNLSVLNYVVNNVSSDERETLKRAVREVAFANTGATFEQINELRLKMLEYTDESELRSEINREFETLIAAWQEHRITGESIEFLREKVNFTLEDKQLTAPDFSSIQAVMIRIDQQLRTDSIKVPYSLLFSYWKDFASPWRKQLKEVALVENGIPESNYKKYDIWGISSEGLIHFDGQDWLNGIEYRPKSSTTIDEVIYNQIGLEESELLDQKKMELADFNSSVKWDRLNEVFDSLSATIPEDSLGELRDALEQVRGFWRDMTADQERLSSFLREIESTLEGDSLTTEDYDRFLFLAARIDRRRLPDEIIIPFSMVLESEPTSVAGTGKYLWVGTVDGLFRYEVKKQYWRKYTVNDGLPSNNVKSLSSPDNSSLWIATTKGAALYSREKWTPYAAEAGINDSTLYLIYAASSKNVWLVGEKDMYHFNGEAWNDSYVYETAVNDSVGSVIRDFIGFSDRTWFSNRETMMEYRIPNEGGLIDPGTEIELPYSFLLNHRINSLAYDSDDRLWLGTEQGLKIFQKGRTTCFGYKPYRVAEQMDVEAIAADFLGTDNQAKIDQLARRIRDYNGYGSSNKVPAGEVVYVYNNSLGSEIGPVENEGGRVFIGTQFGMIVYAGDKFNYFYEEGLERQQAVDIETEGGEIWFVTPGKIVIFADAKSEITGMHANWLPELADDIYYEFLSYIHHLGQEWGTIGLSVTFLSYGELVRSDPYGRIMGTFNSFDMAVGLSYGKMMTGNLSAGITAKWIYSRLSDQGAGNELGEGTGSSLGIDLGLLYRPTKRLNLGATVTNLGPDISYIDAAQSDPLPRNLALGFSFKLIDNPYNRLMIVGEVNKMLTGLDDGFSEELKEAIENVGFEYWYGSFIAFRAGYIYDQVGEVKTPTLGVGLQYRGFRFDFAYIPSSDTVPLANTVRFSLTGRI
ncbi:MAG: PorV/PorQ family protein [candidate division Zixibacteria bacterium]|nr:PorV/PorQ family protein [candidate division Zixibacteria bacterium]